MELVHRMLPQEEVYQMAVFFLFGVAIGVAAWLIFQFRSQRRSA